MAGGLGVYIGVAGDGARRSREELDPAPSSLAVVVPYRGLKLQRSEIDQGLQATLHASPPSDSRLVLPNLNIDGY